MNNDIDSLKIRIHPKNINDFHSYFSPVIDQFVTVLEENFPKEALQQFYQNMVGLKLVKRNVFYAAAAVDMKKNELIYKSLKNKNNYLTLFHELFHISSHHGKNFGFCNEKKDGIGINEGVTDYFSYQYFYSQKHVQCSYDVETSIASVLSSIIGEDRLKELYINADLDGLMKELEKYSSREEVAKFIQEIDIYNMYNTYLTFLEKFSHFDNYMKNIVKDLSRNLAKMYIKKNINILSGIALDENDKIIDFYFDYSHLIHKYYGMITNYCIEPLYLYKYLTEMGYDLCERVHVPDSLVHEL